jgi:hypothetical protein
MRCRKIHRQCQKPGEHSLLRDKCRGYLGDRWLALALGIKAAGLVYGLIYGTVETTWRCKSKRCKWKTVRSKVEKRRVVADEAVVVMKSCNGDGAKGFTRLYLTIATT